jgi:ATP-binding cassette subfamily B protein
MKVLRKFIGYYKPYKAIFFIDMFCALVASAVDLSFPLIFGELSKQFFQSGPDVILHYIWLIGAGLVAMYAVKYFCQYYITSWGHIMGARMESNMRQDLFYHMQRLSFSYYDENNTGEMMSKLVSDLFDISELAHHGPENVFISFVKIVGAFAIMFSLNVSMTLILSVVTFAIIVFSIRQNLKMRAIFYDNRVKIAGVNASVQDSLAGIRIVKSFANECVEQKKFDESNNEFLKSKVKNYTIMGRFQAGNAFFEGLLFIVILVSGCIFISRGTLTVTDLAVYALYINIFINPIDVLVNFTEQFQKGYAGFKRFLGVIETKPEVVDRPGARPLTEVRGEIEFDDVTFGYGEDKRVLDHINIKVRAGSNVALVGPSGGGKTTICSLLPRFYDVSSGSIKIDGTDIRDVTLNSLRNAIGIVQQDVYLFDGSIRDNIAYGKPGATDEEIIEAAKNANIYDFIQSLEDGFDTYAGERGVKLSGGQKQRISIARVFLKNPPVLILDEATSALDNESERYIQQSLEALSKNRTTIVIAHRLSTVHNADEIIVITDEGIRERGCHSELIRKDGIYARYYNMQFEGIEETGIVS